MQTLRSRLDHLGNIYHLQVGPLLLVLGSGLHSSRLLAWTGGVLLGLASLNKLHMPFVRQEAPVA